MRNGAQNACLVTVQDKKVQTPSSPVLVNHSDLHEFVEEHLNDDVVILISYVFDYNPKFEADENE